MRLGHTVKFEMLEALVWLDWLLFVLLSL